MTPYPKTVLIGTSTVCQYGCIFCNNPREGLIPKVSLSVERIADMISEFKDVALVDISGYGELIVHPDFTRLIETFTNRKVPFTISTNGEALDLEKQGLLRRSSLNQINFSVNSLVPETHSVLTGGKGHLEVVLNNLESFAKRPRSYKISISMVANRYNFKEMSSFVEYASKIGVEMVRLAAPVKVINYPYGFDLFGNEEEHDALVNAHRIAKENGITMSGMTPSVDAGHNAASKLPIRTCRSPWDMTGINPDGAVTPCCFLPFYVVGNINNDKFSEIWDGEKMTALRSAVMAGDNRICKDCMEFE